MIAIILKKRKHILTLTLLKRRVKIITVVLCFIWIKSIFRFLTRSYWMFDVRESTKDWHGLNGLTTIQQDRICKIVPDSTSTATAEAFMAYLEEQGIIDKGVLDINKTSRLIESALKRNRRKAEHKAKRNSVKRTSIVMPGGSPPTALERLRLRGII